MFNSGLSVSKFDRFQSFIIQVAEIIVMVFPAAACPFPLALFAAAALGAAFGGADGQAAQLQTVILRKTVVPADDFPSLQRT